MCNYFPRCAIIRWKVSTSIVIRIEMVSLLLFVAIKLSLILEKTNQKSKLWLHNIFLPFKHQVRLFCSHVILMFPCFPSPMLTYIHSQHHNDDSMVFKFTNDVCASSSSPRKYWFFVTFSCTWIFSIHCLRSLRSFHWSDSAPGDSYVGLRFFQLFDFLSFPMHASRRKKKRVSERVGFN